jgi:hypothetical protein
MDRPEQAVCGMAGGQTDIQLATPFHYSPGYVDYMEADTF